MARADLEGLGVAPRAQRRVGEDRLEQGLRRQRPGGPGRRRALHGGGLQPQAEFVDHRLQAVGLLVDGVRELLGDLGEAALSDLAPHLFGDLGAHRLERPALAAAHGVEADDVEAEVGLDDAADLADRQREGGLLEGRHHRAAAEPVEVAAGRGRAGVFGVRARQLGKARRVGARLREQGLGARARLGPLIGRGVALGTHEDVARAPLLGRGKTREVLLVVPAQVLFGHRGFAREGLHVEHDELDLRLLGGEEARLLRRVVVVRLQLGVGRRDRRHVLGCREALQLQLAALEQRAQRRARRLRGQHAGGRDAAQHLLQPQVLPQPGLELLDAQALGQQQVTVDAAVGQAQEGQLRVFQEAAPQPLVGGRQHQALRSLAQHLLAHELVERLALELGAVEQPRIDAGRLAADLVDAVLVRGVPLALRDLARADRGHRAVGRVDELRVALDAQEDERRDDQDDQDEQQQLGVGADELEHGRPRALRRTWRWRKRRRLATQRAPAATGATAANGCRRAKPGNSSGGAMPDGPQAGGGC